MEFEKVYMKENAFGAKTFAAIPRAVNYDLVGLIV
jgi:hypothetical protein